MKNEALRENLISRGDEAFMMLTKQIDVLFDLTGFFFDRYSDETPSNVMKRKDLKITIENIAELTMDLAEIINDWKKKEPRVLSRSGTEISIIGELWVNIQAILYFLTSHGISLDGFNVIDATHSYHSLVGVNRLIT